MLQPLTNYRGQRAFREEVVGHGEGKIRTIETEWLREEIVEDKDKGMEEAERESTEQEVDYGD